MKIDRQSWWRLPQKLRFLAAGAYNTAFGYAIFTLLFLLMGRSVHYLVIGLIAHSIAMLSAFIVYRRLVFKSLDSWMSSFIRFNISQCAALGFGLGSLYVLVEFGNFNPLLAQLMVISASVFLSYILHSYFSFDSR